MIKMIKMNPLKVNIYLCLQSGNAKTKQNYTVNVGLYHLILVRLFILCHDYP